jgi:hypothetical protein
MRAINNMPVQKPVPPPPDTQPSLEIVPRKHTCRWRRMVESTARELEGVRAEVAELRAARDAAEDRLAAALDQLTEYERGLGRARLPARSRAEVPARSATRRSGGPRV